MRRVKILIFHKIYNSNLEYNKLFYDFFSLLKFSSRLVNANFLHVSSEILSIVLLNACIFNNLFYLFLFQFLFDHFNNFFCRIELRRVRWNSNSLYSYLSLKNFESPLQYILELSKVKHTFSFSFQFFAFVFKYLSKTHE